MSDRWLMAIQDTFYFRRRQSAASALSRPRFFAMSVGFTNVYLPKPKVNPDPRAGRRAGGGAGGPTRSNHPRANHATEPTSPRRRTDRPVASSQQLHPILDYRVSQNC